MPCNQSDATRSNLAPINSTDGWTHSATISDRILFVSNSPEQIGVIGSTPILYRAKLPFPLTGVLRLRVWLWHLRLPGSPEHVYIGCKVTGAGLSGNLTQHRSITGVGGVGQPYGSLEVLGRCLAKAQLFGTLDTAANHLLPLGTNLALASYDVPVTNDPTTNPIVRGAIHEFQVEAEYGSFLDVWTAAGDSTLPNVTAGAAPADAHIRGVWPACGQAFASTGPIDIQPGGVSEKANYYLCKNSGIESTLYTAAAADALNSSYAAQCPASTNKGLYGVDLNYTLQLTNGQPSASAKGFTSIRCRNTSRWYAGAFEAWLENPSPAQLGIPRIEYGTPLSGVQVGASVVNAGETKPFTFRLTNAGAATLPACVQVNALGVGPPP